MVIYKYGNRHVVDNHRICSRCVTMGTGYENKKEGAEMTCLFCKGDMVPGTTSHVAQLDKCIIIIKNVPCMKCTQCGEVVYSGKVVEKLEQLADAMENTLTEVAIINFPTEAA